jgi:hypothetical protein
LFRIAKAIANGGHAVLIALPILGGLANEAAVESRESIGAGRDGSHRDTIARALVRVPAFELARDIADALARTFYLG